jgi:glycine cleavage system regulatory protein
VERVTEVIVAHAANWEESRMARLGGEFAGIVLISVADERSEALAESLRALADEQMTVVVKLTQPTAETAADTGLYHLHLKGADHEGIVHTVSAYLAGQGINVEEMETDVIPAPITASPLFQMEARIHVPQPLSFQDLKVNLERIGEDLGVDIDLRSES